MENMRKYYWFVNMKKYDDIQENVKNYRINVKY